MNDGKGFIKYTKCPYVKRNLRKENLRGIQSHTTIYIPSCIFYEKELD